MAPPTTEEVKAMLSNDTCEKLKGMGLEAFLKGLIEQQKVHTYEDKPFEERFSLLIDFEIEVRAVVVEHTRPAWNDLRTEAVEIFLNQV